MELYQTPNLVTDSSGFLPAELPSWYTSKTLMRQEAAIQVGYARTSTIEQAAGYEAQVAQLRAAGCDKLFAEQISSVAERPQLAAALDYLREGDTLVVTKLDRLARSVAHLVAIGVHLDAKGASLKVLDQAIDTSTPTGRLMFNMLGSIAQFERELMLERQREGIARAKAAGKYKGRRARIQAPEVKRLRLEGMGPTTISQRLGISRASVYRALSA